MLGSPVPIGLVATTLNSYSTQGFSSTAMADSMSPVMISGTMERKEISCHWVNFIFLGSKITANCDCSHEIKRTCAVCTNKSREANERQQSEAAKAAGKVNFKRWEARGGKVANHPGP